MKSSILKRMVASVLLCGAVTAQLAQTGMAADATMPINIKAQPLAEALQAFGKQTGLQVLLRSEGVSMQGVASTEVSGELSAEQALGQLLQNTGLQYEFINDKTVRIAPAHSMKGAANMEREARGTAASLNSSSSDVASVEEIIVTARKAKERLQDVPVPVTAINGERLVEGNQLRIQDYYASVPGLNVMPSIQSQQTLSIRGITTGTGNPTVGVTVDDMPYGSSTNIGGGRAVPDIDPGDLAQIEVLRGPQGTLYGASSLGGLLKFVTLDPSMDRFSGRIQAGTSSIERGELGYNVRGSINAPLADTVGLRVSAFTRQDAGYVDNVQTGEEDVNSAEARGGRAALLWRPSERFSLKLSALLQEIEGDGSISADPALGDLRQSRLRDTGWYDRKVEAYAATVTAKLGAVELTSISGYNLNSFSDAFDLTYALGPVAQSLYGAEFSGVPLLSTNETEKLTQEVRLTAPLGEKFEWLLGVFYTDEDSDLTDNRIAVNPATGASPGRLTFADYVTSFEEVALFANLTYHFTDRFDVQIGGRQSEIRQTYQQIDVNASDVRSVSREFRTDGSAFTYLVTPRFKVSEDLMVYARLASGYRAGGPNINPGGVVPVQYEPDETQNYEVGVKAELLDRKLSLDASLYHIDWKDIQLSLLNGGFTFTTNGSRARSQGLELAVQARPLTGLKVAAWTVWNNAELTEPLPPGSPGTAVGAAGSRLPITARFSANLSVDQEFPLVGSFDGFVGCSASYVGERQGPFRSVAVRQDFDDYTQWDLRAGIRNGVWTANVFVINVGDERGALYGGLGANPPTAFNYIQPRTVGLTLGRSF